MSIKKIKSYFSKLTLTYSLAILSLSPPVFAGGLDEATKAVEEIKASAYTFLGVVVFLFLIYKVIMALMDKETWGDVLGALGKVALAGGILVAGEWAWQIFGTAA
jgi:uncharacterized membrane protein